MLRPVSITALAGGLLFVAAAMVPDHVRRPDPELYVSAGCSSCHGAEAGGAFGPTLAGTGLTFEAFLAQLRTPRGEMPPVAPGLVSDEQARGLFDWVAGLDEPEGGPLAGTACRHHQHGPGHHGQGRGCRGECRHGDCRQPSASGG